MVKPHKKLLPGFEKHVCYNCANYRKGLCAVRKWGDMEHRSDKCPDWTPGGRPKKIVTSKGA